ncbi:general secretion pathway protein GspC [Paraburkholderia agricolaris]|uniref:General secretion pathway protein GspC n=1 Tax=Paraburkholderia agricolaris TaxID=2152888 RepID=A0ABW8ZZ43_9BURK
MRLQLRPTLLATIASAALFAAVSAWSAHVLLTPLPHANPQAQPTAAIDATGGAVLFGAAPDQGRRDDVQLLGILAFDPHHAAAIVSVGGEAAHVVRVHGAIGTSATLAEVHGRSIVVEHNGVRREIALPAVDSPSAFVR